jgi:cytochrome c oxidase subunit 2
VACHQANGKGAPPAIKGLDGSAIVLNDPLKQTQIMLNGVGAMPAWKQLSDTDIAAVMTYTKNSWSNQTGKLIQPSEVAAVRAGGTVQFASAGGGAPAAAVSAPATAPAGLPVQVLFAVGRSALDAAAQKEVAKAIELLKGSPDAKVALSGYVDSSGSAAKNAELAKQRAFAVRDALTKAGIAAGRIELKKPEQIDAGDAARARRVDIVSAS